MTENRKLKNEENEEEVKLKHKERRLKLLESKKNKPSDYFYQVTNPAELAKIGESYLADFRNGVKSFAISSTNYKASQQRTILALASYFDHLFDMKILIISDSLDKGVFEEVMQAKKVEITDIPNSDKQIEINHFYHHFDLIDLNKILKLTKSEKASFDFEIAMQNLLSTYDIIFWDTPIINTQKNNSHIYSHTMNYFESLTIIVSPAVSKASNVNEIKDHFTSFGVNVKGVLFDPLESQINSETKKWTSTR